jgi:hypothetical protein
MSVSISMKVPPPGGDPAAQQPPGGDVRPRLIPGSDQTEGEVPAAPQDEADLDQTVNKALLMIHGRKSRDQILKALHDPNGKVSEVVGRLTVTILMSVSDQKRAGGSQPLSEDVLQEAAGYIVPELMKVGCAAGIFPFEDPDDDEPGSGPGEFNNQVRMAMLEATKYYGEKILKQPGAQQRSEEAGTQWAAGIAREVDNGTASPQFMQAVQGQGQAAGKPRQLIEEKA